MNAAQFREALPELQWARQNPNARLKAMNALGALLSRARNAGPGGEAIGGSSARDREHGSDKEGDLAGRLRLPQRRAARGEFVSNFADYWLGALPIPGTLCCPSNAAVETRRCSAT